eukprot:5009412-Pleurochrysis_carterae.AAC.1
MEDPVVASEYGRQRTQSLSLPTQASFRPNAARKPRTSWHTASLECDLFAATQLRLHAEWRFSNQGVTLRLSWFVYRVCAVAVDAATSGQRSRSFSRAGKASSAWLFGLNLLVGSSFISPAPPHGLRCGD